MSRPGARQHGMAVLGALIIIVIVVALAASVGMRSMHSIAATARSFEARAADGLFEALELDSQRMLRVDARKERYDALGDPWASAVLQVNTVQGRGEARLRDAQGLFNLHDISFDAEVVAQAAARAQLEDQPLPDATVEQAAGSQDTALGGAIAGGLLERPSAIDGLRSPAQSPPRAAGGRQQTGDSIGMMALAAVPGVAASGAAGAVAAQGEQGLQLSPQQIALARFALLLRNLEIDEAVLPAILDWMDADSDERFPNGAEDDFYSRLKPAYRSANHGFADISELKLVRGIDDEVFAKLRPFVTVLPDVTAINVNTAPLEILMSLGPGMDRATANMVVEARKIRPFRTVAEFRELPMLLGRPLVSQGLAVGSDFFTLEMDVASGQLAVVARALLARRDGDNVLLLRRDKGFFDD